jgi:opacity protein-like surface antigen
MQRTVIRSIVMTVIVISSGLPLDAMAQDVSSSGQVPVSENRKTEFYGALSILGTIPKDENLNVGGTTIPNTHVNGSAGAGVKAGIFPKFAEGIFGVEGEVFGHGGKLNAPGQAQGDLTVVNFMVNVLARYPGEIFQPYVGTGVGLSAGQLRDANIQTGSTQLTGKSTDGAGAVQLLGGVRAYVMKKIFLFGEYRYFASDYEWDSEGISTGSPSVKYDFRTQIVSGGIGISF